MAVKKLSQLDIATKIGIIVSYAIKISLVVAVIEEIYLGRWSLLFVSLLALILTFLPAMIEKNYEIILPVEFELAITLFIYASLVLGEKRGFYERFPWWDLFLHGISGMLAGLVGFLTVYVIYAHQRVKISPLFVALFSFSFSVATGTLWEIYEFFMDSSFGLNMQKSGLVDTMGDLIIDCGGALIAALGGYFYVKGGDSLLISRFLKSFFRENPKLSR